MTPINPLSLQSSSLPEGYRGTAAARQTSQTADSVDLSPSALREAALTGHVAMNEQAGNISSDQADQLYSQIASIQSQITAFKQANGGQLSVSDEQLIGQFQDQVRQAIYSDAHNGEAPPTSGGTAAGERQALLAGRIELKQQAGNLSSDQAGQLFAQVGQIEQQMAADKQADGGALSATDAQAINQLQTQLSQQIRDTGH